MIELIRLVGESAIVIEDVPQFTAAFWLGGDKYQGFSLLDIHHKALDANAKPEKCNIQS
jgi:hypothetical protein